MGCLAFACKVEKAAVTPRLERCREILGIPARDPLSGEWQAMTERERKFWMRAAGCNDEAARLRDSSVWAALHATTRGAVRAALERSAQRAAQIVGAGI